MSTIQPGLVSVIIPMYNVAATLDQCLDSIQTQTHADLEIICVNDGSPDKSSAIAHAHAEKDARITVVDKPNAGYGASCNRGLDLARGEWVSIVEPDDYLEPTMYEALLAKAAECAQTGGRTPDVIKCAYWRVFDENGSSRRVTCPYKGRVKPARQPFAIGDGVELLCHHPAIWAAVYRNEFLAQRGIRFREVAGSGWTDNPFMVQTLCGTQVVAYVDEPLYDYREHDLNDAENLAARSPLIPLTRWNEMMDEAEAAGVTDARVIDALALRGVNYANITLTSAPESVEARELAVRSMERLDAQEVLASRRISPNGKALFCELRGLPAPTGGRVAHLAHMAGEALYRVRTNGLGFAVETAKRRLKR